MTDRVRSKSASLMGSPCTSLPTRSTVSLQHCLLGFLLPFSHSSVSHPPFPEAVTTANTGVTAHVEGVPIMVTSQPSLTRDGRNSVVCPLSVLQKAPPLTSPFHLPLPAPQLRGPSSVLPEHPPPPHQTLATSLELLTLICLSCVAGISRESG